MIYYSRRNKGARRGSVRSREQWNVVVVVRQAVVAAWTVALAAASLASYRLKVSSVNNGTSSSSMALEGRRQHMQMNKAESVSECCKIDRSSYLRRRAGGPLALRMTSSLDARGHYR